MSGHICQFNTSSCSSEIDNTAAEFLMKKLTESVTHVHMRNIEMTRSIYVEQVST